MINALICAHKSGDVIGLALRQLIDAPCVTRILVADGPHGGPVFGTFHEEHSVREVVDSFKSDKIVYRYTDNLQRLGEKCNNVLKHVSADCKWILVVDSDEVYHEDSLPRLAKWLETAEYGRYSIKTLDLYPDFHHFIKIPDWKPRLYQWFPGARCSLNVDDAHQYVLDGRQKRAHNGRPSGLGLVPPGTCTVYHLNALRPDSDRVTLRADGKAQWHGGGERHTSLVYPFHIQNAPKCIRDLNRRSL